ncbi:MAG: helix-turn-helix domain-containing protein, partial [Opitutales bacterium]
MPKTPLTDLDKEVGARLKMAREALELPAVFIADEIEVTHDRIANYETGRTKLPWDVALHLFNQFRRISIPWLGEGIEPILVRDNKAPLLTVKKGVYPFYSRMPFHEVYKALWSDEIGSINSTSAWKAQTSKDDMFLALDQRVSMF